MQANLESLIITKEAVICDMTDCELCVLRLESISLGQVWKGVTRGFASSVQVPLC